MTINSKEKKWKKYFYKLVSDHSSWNEKENWSQKIWHMNHKTGFLTQQQIYLVKLVTVSCKNIFICSFHCHHQQRRKEMNNISISILVNIQVEMKDEIVTVSCKNWFISPFSSHHQQRRKVKSLSISMLVIILVEMKNKEKNLKSEDFLIWIARQDF